MHEIFQIWKIFWNFEEIFRFSQNFEIHKKFRNFKEKFQGIRPDTQFYNSDDQSRQW